MSKPLLPLSRLLTNRYKSLKRSSPTSLHSPKSKRGSRSLLILILLLLWSLCLGWGLAQAVEPAKPGVVGTVDVVSDRYKFGQELYLENCATCHIAIPPAVLPTETWRDLLQDSEHYGVELKPLIDPPRRLVWNYLQTFSRQLPPEESTPYRVADSNYFRVLHPKIDLPRKFTLASCATCHPGANQYNFRSLTAEWAEK
jgi:Dihaem cytochrome c